MTKLLDEKLSKYLKYEKPDGGLFIWCQLPQNVDMPAFCKAAVDNKVAVVPGNAFSVDTSFIGNCIRLNYSTPTDEQIVTGMELLSKTAEEFFK